MKGILLICLCMILLSGCSVPEFTPPPVPSETPGFGEEMSGNATWYGTLYHGRITDSGEQFDMEKLTGSHVNIPLGTQVEVTNPQNGKTVRVVINDRHNLEKGHVLSISQKAAKKLGVYPNKNFIVNYMVIE